MTLRLVAPERQPWDQLPGEDEAEYMLFLYWLHGPKPRPLPDSPRIALERQWSERASAYDAAHTLPRTPKDQLARMLTDALQIGVLEVRKLLRQVQRNQDTRELSFRDLIALINTIQENKPALEKALAEETDENIAADLTEEEMRSILDAKRALAKIGGRK